MKAYIFEIFQEVEEVTKKEYQKYIDLLKKATYKLAMPETKLVKDWQNDQVKEEEKKEDIVKEEKILENKEVKKTEIKEEKKQEIKEEKKQEIKEEKKQEIKQKSNGQAQLSLREELV